MAKDPQKPSPPSTPQEVMDKFLEERADKSRSEKLKEGRMERLKTLSSSTHKWFEDHSSFADGRIGRLLKKFEVGEVKVDALIAIRDTFQEGNKWDKKGHKKLLEQLERGKFKSFGVNFPQVAKALEGKYIGKKGEGKDEELQQLAEAFILKNVDISKIEDPEVRQAAEYLNTQNEVTFTSETTFLEMRAKLYEKKIQPNDAIEQTKGLLAKAGLKTGSGTEKAVEMARQTNLGLLPEPPKAAKESLPETARRLTEYLERSTKELNEMSDLVKKSEGFASSKATLKEKLKSDPEFAQKLLDQTVLDYDLLKRSSTIVKRTTASPALKEALKKFNKQRRTYLKDKAPETLQENESLHQKFLQAKEAQPAREALMEAMKENQEVLLETSLDLEMERAVDETVFDAVNNGAEINEDKLATAASKIATKYTATTYDPENPLLETDVLTKLKEKAETFVSNEKENADARKEYMQNAFEISKWQALCTDLVGHVNIVQKMTGLKLTETEDGWGVFPRNVKLKYRDYEEEGLVSELDPEAEPKPEVVLNEKGQAVRTTKTAEIVGLEYKPQEVEEEDRETWHTHIPRKGLLKITVRKEKENGEIADIEMSMKEFLGWVAHFGVHEDMKTSAEATDLDIKKGTILAGESRLQDPPQYTVIEIEDVTPEGVILKEPVEYISDKERLSVDRIRGSQTRKKLTHGELYSLITRRNMFQLDKPADLSALSKDPKGFWSSQGARGDGETKWLELDGTLGDVFEKHGPAIFGGAALTASQLDAFKRHPAFAMRFLDPNKRQFIKKHIPGARLMQDASKYDMEELMEAQEAEQGMLGSPAGQPIPQELPAEMNPFHTLSPEQKQEIEEDKEEIKEAKKAGDIPKHISMEALTSDEAGIEGETRVEKPNYLRGLWQRTRVMASDDMWELGKAIYEHYERRWHRRSKEKYASVGEALPLGYGTEMSRIKQQAENEEVTQNQEAMENWGEWQVQDALRKSRNKDQVKACFVTLAKGGHLRWDDIDMWRTLNHFIPSSLSIPIPAGHNAFIKDKKTGRTGFDYLDSAIDYLWGEGQYQEWYQENNNIYDQKLKNYYEQGEQLEGDPKQTESVDGQLRLLLEKHKKGEFVDSHQYEGLLWFIIHAGKGAGPEAKLYYIVQGASVPNPVTGETLLSWDRLGSINGEFLNRFPIMDYLTRRDVPRKDGTTTAWTVADYRRWVREWDAAALPGEENKPNQAVTEFLWKNVLTDEKLIIRNNKGVRNAQEMDHDDAHVIIPLTDEELVENLCMNSGGQRKYFTVEGYGNAYPGYNHYMKTLAGLGDKAKLINCVRSFTRFNSIMDKRYHKEKNTLARLGPSAWNRPSIVDSRQVIWHKKQLEQLIEKIAYAYGDEKFIDLVETMHTKTGSVSDPVEAEKQKKVQVALDNFGDEFAKLVKTDGAAKLMNITNNAQLSGMETDITQEEKIRRKQMLGGEDELTQVFSDWQADASF